MTHEGAEKFALSAALLT